jgi:hypothetical protein
VSSRTAKAIQKPYLKTTKGVGEKERRGEERRGEERRGEERKGKERKRTESTKANGK